MPDLISLISLRAGDAEATVAPALLVEPGARHGLVRLPPGTPWRAWLELAV